jgi:hypothetical protein
MKKKTIFTSLVAGLVVALGVPLSVAAAPPPFGLAPFEFVGTVSNCGVAGTDTVTATWDNGTGNPAPSILLQKLGATTNCAAAGVNIITSLEGGPVSALTELNFDYKTDGHCGGGAPRFNLELNQTSNAFLGCNSTLGTRTDLNNGWTHVEFTTADIAAAVTTAGGVPTDTLSDLYIIFDEGTDTPAGGTIVTPGTVYIDNISVNGQVVGSPETNVPTLKDQCKKDGWKSFGDMFKNQGDCVSFVASKGKNQPSGPETLSNHPTF